MPYYVTGSREGDLELSLLELRETATKTNALLCEACEWLEGNDNLGVLPDAVREWWEERQRLDAQRRRVASSQIRQYRLRRAQQLRRELAELEDV